VLIAKRPEPRQPDPEGPVPHAKFGALDGAMEHSQLVPQSQILGHQCGTTGKKASNEHTT